MLVSVLTPTCDRPEALGLCKRWFSLQTHKGPMEHIIEHGGDFYDNMANALERASGDLFVIFEDDDYYSPDYVKHLVPRLNIRAPLWGQRWGRLYHLPSGGYNNKTGQSGPFACTMAWHKSIKDRVLELLKAKEPIKQLYREVRANITNTPYMVAMKAMPGKPAIKRNWHTYSHEKFPYLDTDRRVLREWVGEENSRRYLQLIHATQKPQQADV